jgi:hypothetical protein
MRILLAAALLAAGPAMSATEMVARQGNDEVRIYDQKCETASVLRHISEANRAQFRKAMATIGGKRWYACYVIANGGAYLVYEDGDQGFVPGGDFKEALGV